MATTVMFAAIVFLSAPGCSHAQPSTAPATPQPDAPCSENLAGALAQTPASSMILECRSQPSGGHQWKPFTDPYPASDRWLTYGPDLTLHGEGRRNPELKSGGWTATPQDPQSHCSAEQSTVIRAGEVGPPQLSTGEPGQPLRFEVLPSLFSIKLSGNCLWQRTH